VCIALLVLPAVSLADKYENSVACVLTNGAGQMPYRVFLPDGWQKTQKEKLPMILFLHGAGERGNDNKLQVQYHVDGLLAAARKGAYRAILVAPQCPEDKQWVDVPWTIKSYAKPVPVSTSMTMVLDMIAKTIAEYPVDTNRIYVTGLSMGGFGVYDILFRRPDLFAAAVPLSGGGATATAPEIKNIPVWAFHGEDDDVVSARLTRDMVTALKKAGGDPKYTGLKEKKHVIWAPIYNGTVAPDLYRWLFSQNKKKKSAASLPEKYDHSIAATHVSGDEQLPYRLFRPDNWESEKKPLPLVLFLHGAGKRGNDNIKPASSHIDGLIAITKNGKYRSFLLTPQCAKGKRWAEVSWQVPAYTNPVPIGSTMKMVLETLDNIIKEYTIDTNRIYVTGLSMGGLGTFDIIFRRPDMFAAAAPLSGGGATETAKTIAHIPLWAFHGSKDKAVSVTLTRELIAAMKKAGGNPKYTELEGQGHVIWKPIYDGKTEKKFYPWFFGQKK
jgi:predicted peptidase